MWYLVIGFLFLLYLLLNTVIPGQGALGIYLLGPCLWILLTVTVLFFARQNDLSILRFKRVRRWRIGNSPVQAGLLIGGFQISLLIIIGLFAGFGTSPYSFSPASLMINIFFVSTFLLGTEVSRAYLIRRGVQSRRYTTLVLLLTTLLFVFIKITPNQLFGLPSASPDFLLEFIGKILMTSIAINLLASYLSYVGGATASMAYVGILYAFEWFSPVLPSPHWTLLALIGTIVPAIGFNLIQGSFQDRKEHKKRHWRTKRSEQGWTAVAIFSVVMVFFSFGLFGVNPTVIYSGSMQPTLHVGDIAIIQKTKIDDLRQGDIIQYRKDNVTYVHRIYAVTNDTQQIRISTKGDANDQPDPGEITSNQILGKSLFTIPYLGWIQIFLRNILRTIGVPIG
jgi:signal peptidase I